MLSFREQRLPPRALRPIAITYKRVLVLDSTPLGLAAGRIFNYNYGVGIRIAHATARDCGRVADRVVGCVPASWLGRQHVVVTAAPPMLDVSDATVGSSIRNELYTVLPLAMNGQSRDPTDSSPGSWRAGNHQRTCGNRVRLEFNGGQPYQNEIYIEGMPQPPGAVGGETRFLSLSISVEAVDQFQVETNNPPTMYQGQGVENYTLKSGTNAFHGAAYEYFRNTVLDAAGYFATKTPIEQQNEFGVNMGGPIKRHKMFFFGSYDGYQYRSDTIPAYQSIPTLKERTGDFSEFPQVIYDPNTTTCSSSGTNCQRTAFPGNIIPASRLSSVRSPLSPTCPPNQQRASEQLSGSAAYRSPYHQYNGPGRLAYQRQTPCLWLLHPRPIYDHRPCRDYGGKGYASGPVCRLPHRGRSSDERAGA